MRTTLDQLFTWITPGYDGFEALLDASFFGFLVPLVGHNLNYISDTKPLVQTVLDELGLPAYLKRFRKARDPEDHTQIRRLGKTRRIVNLWAYIFTDADGNEFLVRSSSIYLGKNGPLMTTIGRYASEMMTDAQEVMSGISLEWRLVRFDLAEPTIFDRLEPQEEKSEMGVMVVPMRRRNIEAN